MKKRISTIILSVVIMLVCCMTVTWFSTNTTSAQQLVQEVSDLIYKGETVKVESKTLEYGGETQEVEGIIYFPDGSSFSGEEFTATKFGIYKVVYTAYFTQDDGIHEVSETIAYKCETRNYDLFTCTGGATVESATFAYSNDTEYSGVGVNLVAGSSVTFDTAIDVKELTRSNSFVDLIIEPSVQGSYDFTELKLRLTDVNDSSKYIDFVLQEGTTVGAPAEMSYMRAGFDGGICAGKENYQNYYHTSNTGSGLEVSFEAYPKYDAVHNLKIFVDNDGDSEYGRGVWASSAAFHIDTPIIVNDFTNTQLYKLNPWTGFDENSKVKLTISASGYKTGTARIIVKQVGKVDLSSEKIKDNQAPTISVDLGDNTSENLPSAKIGIRYDIFDAKVDDNFDSSLEANIKVTYRDALGKDINITVLEDDAGKYFVPTKLGDYIITYSASDSYSNQAQSVKLKITAQDEVNNPTILLPSEKVTEGTIYTTINLLSTKDISIEGGSGKSTASRTVTLNGEEITVDGDSFIPTQTGNYIVKFTATDYLGQTGEINYSINVATLEQPIFQTENLSLPNGYIKGYVYTVPAVKVIKVDAQGKIVIVDADVFVNGEKLTNSTFEVGSTWEEVNIEYKSEEYSTSIYTIPVYDTNGSKDQTSYFISTNATLLEEEEDIKITTSTTSTLDFISKLDHSSLSVVFNTTFANTNSVTIKLRDATNKNNVVTLVLSREYDSSSKEYIYYITNNGKAYTCNPEEITGSNQLQFILKYTNSTKIVSLNSQDVFKLTQGDNLSTFEGFCDGVYLSIEFDAQSEASLYLTKICNQTFGTQGVEGGIKDKMYPTIVYDEDFVFTQQIGTTLKYPSFKAYDVLGYVTQQQIYVVDPNGNKQIVYDSLDTSKTATITISVYGEYKVMYYAFDNYGNGKYTGYQSQVINVFDDVDPTLTVQSLSKTEYNVGDVVSVPTYTAGDNVGKYYVDVILYLPTGEARLVSHEYTENDSTDKTYYLNNEGLYPSSFRVSDSSFKVEYTGTYRIRYIVYDSQYNLKTIDLTFTAK